MGWGGAVTKERAIKEVVVTEMRAMGEVAVTKERAMGEVGEVAEGAVTKEMAMGEAVVREGQDRVNERKSKSTSDQRNKMISG